MSETLTIEIDGRESLIAHIEHLQKKLTERNAKIEELEARINAGEGSEFEKRTQEMGYKRGWIECAGTMMSATRKVTQELESLHKSAFQQYLAGDKLLVEGQRIGGDL